MEYPVPRQQIVNLHYLVTSDKKNIFLCSGIYGSGFHCNN